MSLVSFIKEFKRAAARYSLVVSFTIIGLLPFCMVKVFMHAMIAIGFQFTIRLKRIARESLEIAFEGKKSDEEISVIIRKCFKNFGKGLVELIYYIHHPDKVTERFTFEGKEYLDEALKRGKGVVAVTAHFGNFALMQMAFAQAGYKIKVIIRKARDKKIADDAFKRMKACKVFPIYSIPARKCVTQSLDALKNNEILFVLLDQNFGSGTGVFVDFFGRKAATGTGPIVFAERSGAPILPLFCVRDEENEDNHKIIIEPSFDIEPKEDRDEMMLANVTKVTNVIEKYIRKYPHEWGWMHRRWKTQQAE